MTKRVFAIEDSEPGVSSEPAFTKGWRQLEGSSLSREASSNLHDNEGFH